MDKLGKTQKEILFYLFLVSNQLDKDCEKLLKRAKKEKNLRKKETYHCLAKRSLSDKIAITLYFAGFKSKTAVKRARRAINVLDKEHYIDIIRKGKTGSRICNIDITKKGREYLGVNKRHEKMKIRENLILVYFTHRMQEFANPLIK